ncbi:MAG: PSD1 domain-containing protein [Planctomycetes bacterium]|nr:PSD1 domain-containing protein [Planctomycetota bacterium]
MRTFSMFFLVVLSLTTVPRVSAQPAERKGLEFFETKIRPVLVEHCYKCHSEEARKNKKLKADFVLDSKAGLRKGGVTGPAIVPGKPSESLLLKALRHEGDLQMPRNGKLPAAIVSDFETWIKLGAPDPRDGTQTAVTEIDWAKARQFWAFQAPVKHPLPKVKNTAWPKRDLDHFLLADLEKRSIKPAGLASKRDLIRRATFDLIGLPPTPAQIDAFLKDESAEAFARVVDRLLASPHHGERWGRYWLDVARYAEDKALAFVTPRPHAYRYRDWVVQALNKDMPYDRFVRLQLAGDLLNDPEPDYAVKLAGLGFQGLGQEYHRGSVAAQVIADELDDRVDTLTRGLLGLTVACARCHDHKYDPIPTRDYYSLAAAYNGSNLDVRPLADNDTIERYRAWQKKLKEAEAKAGQFKDKKKRSAAEIKEIVDRNEDVVRLRKEAPPPLPMAHVINGGGTPMRVHQRGNVERLGDSAPPGFLRILPSAKTDKFTRLELANAIADPKNPLTARVIVNRVWHYHFGRGIVGTTSNFGVLGDRPTHPELLDTLAMRFMEAGWSLRWLHREIMLSTAYQLASTSDPANVERDPENQYVWRYAPRRLDFEAWRDAWLAVAGRLDPNQGGPSTELTQADNVRRTFYAKVSRLEPNKLLVLFDFPDANVTSDRRSVTTVPQQQLFVLNSDFTIETAKAFAKRLEQAAPKDEERIALAFRLAYGREPTPIELRASVEFVRDGGMKDQLTPWEQFAQAILASNEFLWVD